MPRRELGVECVLWGAACCALPADSFPGFPGVPGPPGQLRQARLVLGPCSGEEA